MITSAKLSGRWLGWWMNGLLAMIFFSLFTSIFVVWYHLTLAITVGCLVSALGGSVWFFQKYPIEFFQANSDSEKRKTPWYFWLGLGSLVMLNVASIVIMIQHQNKGSLLSPWQTLPSTILIFSFFALIILGLLIAYFPSKRNFLLILMMLQTLTQHLYLPLSHINPWGGDVWRHIAVEAQLESGQFYLPVLFGPEVKFHSVALGAIHLNVPEAFLIPNKYAYGQLWGLSVALAELMHLDLALVNRFLVPVLWSLATPILLFLLGTQLFRKEKIGLWLAYILLLPFSWQAIGALTLPVSLGLITFLLFLTLWFSGERNRRWAYALASLMLFGYTLYFLLAWLVIGISIMNTKSTRWSKALLAIGCVGFFPVFELVARVSTWPQAFHPLSIFKQIVVEWSGWHLVSLLPWDTASGNILFNQIPNYAFVSNLFLTWRWWIIPALGLVYGLTALGLFRGEKNHLWSTARYLFISVFGGYLINWYVLAGDRLFVRRLDATLACLILLFALAGVNYLHSIWQKQRTSVFQFALVLLAVVVFSWCATAAFASGPDIRAVSQAEYTAAESAWQKVDHNQSHYCVLADTWTLLPLEAISAGKIVGGGFPIDAEFSQPERVVLFAAMQAHPSDQILREAQKLTGASSCLFIP